MADEKIEETIENPEEEGEPAEEKPQEGERETPTKPEKTASEIEEANKKLYARMKKAEEEAKLAKEELEKSKRTKSLESQPDIVGLAKTIAALRDYTSDELGDIELIAKAKGIPLEEAATTEEAKILVAARREKVAKEESMPEPSTKQEKGEMTKSLEEMSLDEKNEWFAKRGFVKGFPKPRQ